MLILADFLQGPVSFFWKWIVVQTLTPTLTSGPGAGLLLQHELNRDLNLLYLSFYNIK